MNIKTREDLDRLLNRLKTEVVLAVDSETNGLSVFEGNRPISLSFYFPGTDETFNLAWGHGQGQIEVPEANAKIENFHNWSWAGNGKKQVYKRYWFEQFKRDHADLFGNVPREWVAQVCNVWNAFVVNGAVHVVYFNEPFDVHMMEAVGFKMPQSSEDVRIAVSLAFEDWSHPSIGGNNRLKWQANYWQIPGALLGEEELGGNAEGLSLRVAQYVLDHWDDPMNSSFHLLKRPARVDEIAKKLAFNDKSEMWCLPSDEVAYYAENDTRITWLLREKLLGVLRQFDQVKLYQDISDAQAEFAIRMERNGILLDKERCEELIDGMKPVMAEVNDWYTRAIELQWPTMLPEYQSALTDSKGVLAFTCGSTAKLKAALTVLTGVVWKGTDKEELEHYEDQHGEHEAVEHLKRYRHAQRAVATYLRNWLKSADEDSYIHMAFNVNGAKTGRWSSSSGTLGNTGNGQNIPTRGFNIKECLVSPEGWDLVQADYGQIELRLAAGIAGCSKMIELFNSGADMHAYTRDNAGVRDILFPGLDLKQQIDQMRASNKLEHEPYSDEEAEDEVADYCRSVAKILNFGLLYGGGWRMVSKLLKLNPEVAAGLHYAWNALYPEYSEANSYWTDEALKRRPRPDGSGSILYVTQPISGRTRKFAAYPVSEVIRVQDEFSGQWEDVRVYPMKQQAKDAFNFVVQGLAGYILYMSSLKVCRTYGDDVFRPWAMIHDSLNFYVRKDRLDILPVIRDTMLDWDVNPRLTVEFKKSVDGSWQNLEKLRL